MTSFVSQPIWICEHTREKKINNLCINARMAQKIKAPGQFMWSHFKHEANTTVWFQN